MSLNSAERLPELRTGTARTVDDREEAAMNSFLVTLSGRVLERWQEEVFAECPLAKEAFETFARRQPHSKCRRKAKNCEGLSRLEDDDLSDGFEREAALEAVEGEDTDPEVQAEEEC